MRSDRSIIHYRDQTSCFIDSQLECPVVILWKRPACHSFSFIVKATGTFERSRGKVWAEEEYISILHREELTLTPNKEVMSLRWSMVSLCPSVYPIASSIV